MIRPIMRIEAFLARPSKPAYADDVSIADDLLDTLKAHERECVGMAANMIGVQKRIVAINDGGTYIVMLNPEITRREQPFEAQEGCLSLSGTRPATRYRRIEVSWVDRDFKPHTRRFSGWTAQIIQHEVDHCDGILI